TFKGKLTSGGKGSQTIAYTQADGTRLSLHCAETDESCGLFGKLEGARIHNINLNLGVSGVNKVGGLAGVAEADTKLTQINADTDITGAGSDIGGVIGYGSKISLSAITHQGKVINIGENTAAALVANTGGIAGRLADASVISDSKNMGRVNSESENIESPANCLGGIVGSAETDTTLFNLTNDSIVSTLTTNYVGGIAGLHYKISASGNKNLVNNGYIKGYQRTGGLFGQINNVAGVEGVTDSVNNGTVAGLWQYTGGIAGIAYVPLKHIVNHGTVSGVTIVGGISGQQVNILDHAYNDGMVWSENAVQGCGTNLGGIVGYLNGGYKHSYLTNHGNIIADWAPRMAVNSTTGIQTADDCPNQNYGGIAGYIVGAGTVMENVYNTGALRTSATGLSRCGGIAGWAHSVALTNAKNTGNIKGGGLVGGIFGRFGMRGNAESKKIPFEMKNVENTGNILAVNTTGGIIGSFDMDDEKAEFTFDQIVNRGNVSTSGATIGGIFGIIYTNNKTNIFKNIYNYGNLKGNGSIGGIAGQFAGSMTSDWWEGENFGFFATGPRTMTNTFDSCMSTGNIVGDGNYLGGLFGVVSVPAVAAYASTPGHTYKTVYCPGNGNIYRREIDFTHYNVTSVFNVQNSYFSGDITETGAGNYFGGLIGQLDTRSVVSTFTNYVWNFDSACKITQTNTTSFTVTRLARTNIRNSYALGTISSDAATTGTLFGRLLSQDLVAATDEYKKQIAGEGKNMISSLANLYTVSTLADKGSAVGGTKENNAFLTASNIYTWAEGNPNKLVWGADTSLGGHATFSFNDAGVPVIGSSKLLDTLNAAVASLGLTAWKEASYTLPDSKSVTVPSLDLKPQLATWEPWDGK
ncbi:MAG: hypothetical protein J6A01_00325, partial [Proteobacteria bacterium]|nr:hypothetical protein [Pseudomonadota bacterium]